MTTTAAAAKTLLEMEEVTVVNTRRYQKIVCQRRCMAAATIGTVLSVILFIIAISTTMWAIVEIRMPRKNSTVTVYLGIWGEWRTDKNRTGTTSG